MLSNFPPRGRVAAFGIGIGLSVLGCLLFPALALGSQCQNSNSTFGFTGTLEGVTYNPDGTSTWEYSFLWNGVNTAPSLFSVQLGSCATVESSTPMYSNVGFNGLTGLFGIHWNLAPGDITPNVPIYFTFTLDQAYDTSQVKFGVRSGSYKKRKKICGPTRKCDLVDPLPVTSLQCDVLDPCTGDVAVSWSNAEPYDEIKVLVDGHVESTLGGHATNVLLKVPNPGQHEICVVAIVHFGGSNDDDDDDDDDDGCGDDDDDDGDDDDDDGGNCSASTQACCTVDIPTVQDLPPLNLHCSIDTVTCEVSASWTNAGDYSQIQVLLGGVEQAILPGDATSTSLTVNAGLNEICLVATTICGRVLHHVCCSVECQFPPPDPVTGLRCNITDVCSCLAQLTWHNNGAYDSIEIRLDGATVAILPGSAGAHSLSLPSVGTYELCVVPVANMVTGDQVCCIVTCDDVPATPVLDLDCSVALPSCDATANWINTSDYAELRVFLDGVLVQTLPGGAQAATVALPGAGNYEICVEGSTICGDPIAPVCCTVECPMPPLPVLNLACDLVDPCGCEVSLTWTNQDNDYDTVNVFLEGTLIAALPGATQSLTAVLPGNDTSFQFCVVPVRNSINGLPACCDVSCPTIPLLPPCNLSCTFDPFDCSVTVLWDNESQYSSLDILLDGVVVETITGDSVMYFFPGPVDGLHEICVEATTICGDVLPQVCCSLDCTITPPNPVLNLDCTLTDPCTCSVDLTWMNSEANYDGIRIEIDGLEFVTLAGGAMNATVQLPGPGLQEICVIALRNGVTSSHVCCVVDCPDLSPEAPTLLGCDLDLPSCDVTVSWINATQYAFIELSAGGIVQMLPGNAETATINLPVPAVYEICLNGETICGEVFTEQCCTVECPAPPQPVTGVDCMVTDPCTCEVQLTWTNQELDYDEIRITQGGALVATLDGDVTSHALNIPADVVTELCVIAVRTTLESPAVCCTVTCPSIPASGPTGLVCDISIPDCDVALSWTNTSTYASIQVFVDGVLTQTLSGGAQATSLTLTSFGLAEICLSGHTICGDAFGPVCCTVDCPQPPDPVTNLMCSVADVCTCAIDVSWMNQNADYDSIRVLLDGTEIATVAGQDQMTSVTLPQNGSSEICLIPVRNGVDGDPACCMVSCPPIAATAPSNLACHVSFPDCTTTVTWTNTSQYDSLVVSLDGTPVATLPGSAESANVTLPGSGTYQICIDGTTICGVALPQVCCTADCPFPPDPVTGLQCVISDICTCEIALTWTNQNADYDAVEVLLDGTLVTTLAGSSTSLNFVLPAPGTSEFCLVPVRNAMSATPTCCNVDCPGVSTTAPSGFTCTADPFDCSVALAWTNESQYSFIEVVLDGVVVQSLGGTDNSANLPAPQTGAHEVCLQGQTICGESFGPVCCNFTCMITPPDPVLSLNCSLTDLCTCAVTLDWTNGEANYDNIRILENNIEVALLPGNATTHSLNLAANGVANLCVVPVRNATDGTATCCNVDCPDVPAIPPTDLVCDQDRFDCSVAVSWTNASQYTVIEVLLDGVVVQTLPGTAESTTLPPPVTGTHTICLQGQTICGDNFPQVCCMFDCAITPPQPVLNLTCNLTDVCACTVDLTWTNSEANYDNIQILENGTEVALLAGNATSHSFNLSQNGMANVCVVPIRNATSGDATCCTVDCPEILATAPANLTCDVSLPDCTATLNWMNTSQYAGLTVSLDGMVVGTLGGADETFTVSLPGSGTYQLCIDGTTICNVPLPQICCTVDCPFPPAPVTGLVCTLNDVCTCEFQLSWTNGETDYDALQLLLDGTLLTTLPGNATTHTVTLPAPGMAEFCLVPVRNLMDGPATCCSVDCSGVATTPPSGLTCTPDPFDCSVSVSWTNESQYSFIEVVLDGVVVQTLSGTDTSASLPAPLTGMHTVCLQGQTICGELFPQVCCTFSCDITPPDPVQNLVCTLTDVCTCAVSLTWTNAEANYDNIQVLLGGVEVGLLGGGETSFNLNLPTTGVSTICVIPIRNATNGALTCCDVDCPEVVATAPTNLSCVVGTPPACETSVTWTNTSDYSSLDVFLDGVLVTSVAGTAESATVPLPGSGSYEICVVGTTICGDMTPQACCTAECPFPPLPVTDLMCELLDQCTCEVLVSWMNQETDYDEIQVLVDGMLVTTVSGASVQATINLPSSGGAVVCVIPVRNTLEATATCCSVVCDDVPLLPPTAPGCTLVDPLSCLVQVGWNNLSIYSSIRVLIDGVEVVMLPGNASNTTVQIPQTAVPHEICLVAETICGDVLPEVCCTFQCGQEFVRGDCNVDGIVNIADAIKINRFLFQGLPVSTCLDACDHNDDGIVDISDVIFLVNYIFLNGPTPDGPFPLCGIDATDDMVPCLVFDMCP